MNAKDSFKKETLHQLTANQLLKLYEQNEVDSSQVLSRLLERTKRIDPKVKAFVKAIDKPKVESTKGRLKGIPIAVKDNICIKGIETTCCSKILKGFIPAYNATVIEKLRQAGAIIIAKTNMDEFAFGSSTENSCFGLTKNPWNLECVSGGSSGGSAAAVASSQVPLALGSDTGGSIRQPASFCGVVGMKPTYGRVSRYGLIAFGSSLDQIGPFARDVSDLALLLSVISGYDHKDSTSIDQEVPDYTKSLLNDIKGLKIGIPKEYFSSSGIQPEVGDAIYQAKETLTNLGAEVVEISLPHTKYAVSVYYIVATAEASSNLARFDGVQYGQRNTSSSVSKSQIIDMYKRTRSQGFGDEAKRRIMLGTFVLSSGYYDAYYLKAQKVRTLITNEMLEALKSCDCIIAPTSPTTAFRINERTDDPLKMYLSDIYTISANLAGLPAMSLPCGFDSGNLPIGLQIIGRPLDEETILRIGYTYEQNTSWHKKSANI